MMQPGLLLETALAATVLGMAVIALGVLVGPLFVPGIVVLIIGLVGCAAAGLLYVLPRYDRSATDQPGTPSGT